MKEVRYFYVPDAALRQELPEEEAQHAVRVLRLSQGDDIVLIDGVGNFYQAIVTVATSRRCLYEVQQVLPQQKTWKGHLHLAMAPTKMIDRVEWFAEKATEIGFDECSLLNCQFSERRVVKTDRLERIVISAMKQSRKAWKPVVNPMRSFRQFIDNHREGRRYIAHCYDEVERVNLFEALMSSAAQLPATGPSTGEGSRFAEADSVSPSSASEESGDTLVLIGPEGDFSIDEVRMALDAGFVSVDLGKSRLRTETAALSAVMMMQLAQQSRP